MRLFHTFHSRTFLELDTTIGPCTDIAVTLPKMSRNVCGEPLPRARAAAALSRR